MCVFPNLRVLPVLSSSQKLPLKQPFESPPAFALLAAPILVILIILFMVPLQP